MTRYLGRGTHSCESCLEHDRVERNYAAARATHITVECTRCGAVLKRTLGELMELRGRVFCQRQPGKRGCQ